MTATEATRTVHTVVEKKERRRLATLMTLRIRVEGVGMGTMKAGEEEKEEPMGPWVFMGRTYHDQLGLLIVIFLFH
jgi:hypothetical protein